MSMSQPAARRAREVGDASTSSRAGARGAASPGSASPGRDEDELDVGLGASGSRSSKLAMCGRIGTAMRSAAAAAGGGGVAGERERVLGGQAARRPRSAARGRAGASRCGAAIERHAVVEQRRVAAEPVDDEALDQRGVGGVEHRAGADEAGDDAAAVDVADQHHRHVGGSGEAHVGDVAGAQVDLGGAAGAFDEHEVGLGGEAAEAVEHVRAAASACSAW